MVERLLDSARRINRARNEIPQPADGARLICARRYGDLVHTGLDSLFACVLAARHASPFIRICRLATAVGQRMNRLYESSAGLSRERPWQSIPKVDTKNEGAHAPSARWTEWRRPSAPAAPRARPAGTRCARRTCPTLLGCWRI